MTQILRLVQYRARKQAADWSVGRLLTRAVLYQPCAARFRAFGVVHRFFYQIWERQVFKEDAKLPEAAGKLPFCLAPETTSNSSLGVLGFLAALPDARPLSPTNVDAILPGECWPW